ncbi:MAG TPA: DUF4097 family beta strand repeat-containing protein [Candidatus Acidoferrales bacterium]|nr:DUF4097 family beta strand repeat-containing protein [Candidatus Acidoferrales bacterium]
MGSLQRGTCIVLLALCAGSLNATVIGAPRAEFRARYSLAANGRVVIQNLYGDVQITGWDREEVLVEATKHSPDARRLDDARIVVDSSDGLVSIRTQYTGSEAENPAAVEYRIMVPRNASLENVKLVNGGLSISGISGLIKASAVNGSIHAEKLEGEADLSTINGQLEADFHRVSRCHPITLSSVNGPIHLSLPSGVSATVSAQNRSGGIDSDFGRSWRAPTGHRLEAAVNGGGTVIRLHNVNGGISIHSTWARKSKGPIS